MNILMSTFNIKDFFLQYLPTSITLIGTLITVLSTILVFHDKNRKNHIYLKWVNMVDVPPDHNQLNVALIISNPSAKDSTITKVSLLTKDNFIDCSPYPTRLVSRGEKPNEKLIYSDITPILIPARKAIQVIISFTYLTENPITNKNELDFKFIINDKEINQNFDKYLILQTDRFVDALDQKFNQNIDDVG